MSSRIANLSAASSGVTMSRCATWVSFPPESAQLDRQTVLPRQPPQRHIGPGADMLNDLRRGQNAQPAASDHVAPPREAGEEPSGEHVACACCIDELGDREGGNLPSLVSFDDDAALFRAG